MRSILRATAVLSASSITSLLVGLATAKAWAVLLGPVGVGYMGLLQGLVGLAGLLAGIGFGTGLVRMAANALENEDFAQVDALQRGLWWLCWMVGLPVAVAMSLFREPIAAAMLGGPEHGFDVILVSLALLCNLVSGTWLSILNVHHRVKALALYGIMHVVASSAISLFMVWRLGERGIALSVVAGSLAGIALSWWIHRRELPPAPRVAAPAQVAGARARLLRFGIPYSASLFVGAGVQFALPALVLNALGETDVGYFRAAVAISVTYLGFLLNAMAFDYYPRVSAVSDQPDQLVALVNQQHRLVLLLAGPMILGLLALAPFLIPLIYDPAFTPAVEVLEWQLVGDVLKFASWTMGFVVVARQGSLVVFGVELLAGVNTLVTSWLGMRLFGVEGAGIGFMLTYATHYLVVYILLRKDIKLQWSMTNLILLAVVLALTLTVRILPLVGLSEIRTPAALVFALVFGACCFAMLWREVAHARGHVEAPLVVSKP